MCHVLEVSTSGYYKWLAKQEIGPTETEKRRKELKQKIRQFFHESFGTYGAERLHKDLLDAGYRVSERTVGRYMQQMGLKAIPDNPYTVTTDSNHNYPIYEDLLEQDFEVEKPNQVWVTDITYIWTTDGWLYLAIVLDLYARKVVGWHAADHMRKDLVLNALAMAVASRQPDEGLIVHSDRGSQYASHDYREKLADIEALGSMSRKGNPFDNACAETFFATIKKELIYRRVFMNRKETIKVVNWYISSFYNENRRHSKNGYLSPNQFERGESKIDAKKLESYLFVA
jgi:transposase InsO family protein